MARGHDYYYIMILSCAHRTAIIRPGVTEEATTRML